MGYWDKYPERFRILFIFLFCLLFGVALLHFFRHATSSSDDNLYGNGFSKIFLNKSIPARVFLADSTHSLVGDTLPKGCVIFFKDNDLILDSAQFKLLLRKYKPGDTVNLDVVDFVNGKLAKYDVKVQKKYISESDLSYLNKFVIIYQITEGGASDRAGLKVGDIITKVNGKPIDDAIEADRLMKKQKSGSIITYEVIRDGETRLIPVKLAIIGIKLDILLYFLVGIILMLSGGFLGWKRPNLPQTRLISLALVSLGFFNATNYQYFTINFDWFTNLIIILNIAALSFGIPALLHTGLYLPRENSEIVKRNWIPLVLYLISATFFTLTLLFVFQFNKIIVVAYCLIIAILAASVFVINIGIIYRKSFFKSFKNAGWIFRGSVILVLLIIVILNIIRLVAYYQVNIPYTDAINFLRRYNCIAYLTLPIAYYYTIWKYRLFDLEFRVRKNIQYSLSMLGFNIIWLLLLGYILYLVTRLNFQVPNLHFNGSTIELIDHPLSHDKNEIYLRVFIILISLLVLWTFLITRKRILIFFDKIFDRVKYDYTKLSSELVPMFERALRESDLSKTIVERLADNLKVSRVGIIIFKDNKTLRNQEFFGLKNDSFKDYIDLVSIKLFEIGSSFRGAFRAEYLPETMKDVFLKHKLGFIIPLRTKTRFLGLIVLGEKLSEMPFTGDEIDFLKSIAQQAAVAVENAILYEDIAKQERIRHELDLARKIQLASLPQKEPSIQGLEISAMSIPAHEVGGDFFDYLNGNKGSITVIIGDVSGKGTSAALHMSKTQGIMRTLYKSDLSPKELLVQTNTILFEEIEKSSFITAVAAKFDIKNKTVSVARAGHLPVYQYKSAEKKVERLMPKGIVLGVCGNASFDKVMEEQTYSYENDDIFVFITDGVTESRNSSLDDFGEERLIYLLEHSCEEPSEDIKTRIVDQIKLFNNGEKQFDDMTIVIVKAKV